MLELKGENGRLRALVPTHKPLWRSAQNDDEKRVWEEWNDSNICFSECYHIQSFFARCFVSKSCPAIPKTFVSSRQIFFLMVFACCFMWKTCHPMFIKHWNVCWRCSNLSSVVVPSSYHLFLHQYSFLHRVPRVKVESPSSPCCQTFLLLKCLLNMLQC